MAIDIESVSAVDLDDAPRRGRKPFSDSPAAKRARERRAGIKAGTIPAPKGARTGAKRPRGAPRTPRTPRTLYPEIAAFLTMANTIVTMTPLGSRYEPTGKINTIDIGAMSLPLPEMRMIKLGDELDEMEIAQLAKAIDAQAQRSPRFKKYVETVLGLGAGFGILSIVGIIVARRAARHNLIDPSLDAKLGGMLNGDLSSLAQFVPTPMVDESPDPDTGERPPIPDSEPVGVSFDDL